MKKQIKSKPLPLSAFQKWKNDNNIGCQDLLEESWNECKRQCLEILNKNKESYSDKGAFRDVIYIDYIKEDAIKEIEKL